MEARLPAYVQRHLLARKLKNNPRHHQVCAAGTENNAHCPLCTAEWQDPRHAAAWDAPPLPPMRRRRGRLQPGGQEQLAAEDSAEAQWEWAEEGG